MISSNLAPSMTTLTTLPLSLQSLILFHLCDWEAINRRAELHLTNAYIPNRRPAVEISLDGVRTVNSPFPSELLAPALASPILAAAAEKLLEGRLSFLTDINTEARLSYWVNAFSEHVEAIAIVDDAETWRDGLSLSLRRAMEEKRCSHAVELFRTISMNHVRLKVLDVVNVPFDECESMQDAMMTGLCATLETCQSTLRELALPVYPESNVCSRALATATLPHLTVLSIELRDRRKLKKLTVEQRRRVRCKFLDMMQAVDGHADRLMGLTSLMELRLINIYEVPCETEKESGCSIQFFRAIKTMRVTTDHSSLHYCPAFLEPRFYSLFTEMECLYRAGPWCGWYIYLEMSRKRLKEVHICHHFSRTGIRVEHKREHGFCFDYSYHRCGAVHSCAGKIRTLVFFNSIPSRHVRKVQKDCLGLQHLSLHVTVENAAALGKLLQKCFRLKTLEMTDAHEKCGGMRNMGSEDWLKMGRVIPGRAKLRELEIQMGMRYEKRAVPIDVLVNCFNGIIKRIGGSVERLLFRFPATINTTPQRCDALCRIMNCCADYSRVLKHLDVGFRPEGGVSMWHKADDCELFDSATRLRLSREKLVESQPYLNKIELGVWHRLLSDLN